MRELVQAVEGDVNSLRQELALGPALEQSIAQVNADSRILQQQQVSRSKRMAYVHGIVSIYGLLEQHVGAALMETASAYESICTRYSQVPERLLSAHREFTLRAMLDSDRVRLSEPINESSALAILASSLNEQPVRLNRSVFTYSTANYRHAHVADLFRRLDVEVQNCPSSPEVLAVIREEGLEFRDGESLLSDLAERRNEIAHSYRVTNLLDATVMTAYLAVVEKYLNALLHAASQRLLHELSRHHLVKIGTVVDTWTSAYGVDMTAGHIQSPCHVLLLKEGRADALNVLSLQSGGETITGRVEYTSETIQLGLGFSAPVPANWKNADVFVLPERWLHLKA
ncbi:HEPN domain-containing protein [Micromonospora aurantiaca (nom. illeg.)]|uniref:HEPN domain-containing protein n=1 Tax=Micromonospora aurantiaca (nom. illeg.) TaxID=47850 RepID=UPI003F4A592C